MYIMSDHLDLLDKHNNLKAALEYKLSKALRHIMLTLTEDEIMKGGKISMEFNKSPRGIMQIQSYFESDYEPPC